MLLSQKKDLRKRQVSSIFTGRSTESVRDIQFSPPNLGYFTFAAAYENGIVQVMLCSVFVLGVRVILGVILGESSFHLFIMNWISNINWTNDILAEKYCFALVDLHIYWWTRRRTIMIGFRFGTCGVLIAVRNSSLHTMSLCFLWTGIQKTKAG